MSSKISRSTVLKALRTVAGISILLVLGLSCSESPIAYSPDGRQIAFAVMEPYDLSKLHQAKTRTYRLMVITDRSDINVIEESDQAMICAPGYSPDGTQLAYLRIPLYTQQQLEQLSQGINNRRELWDQLIQPPAKDDSAQSPQTDLVSAGLPPIGPQMDMLEKVAVFQWEQIELVLRSTDDWSIVRVIRISAPAGKAEDLDGQRLDDYITASPKFSPDGLRIYLRLRGMVSVVHLDTLKQEIIHLGAEQLALSPDGNILAAVSHQTLALIDTDGKKALYWNFQSEAKENISPISLSWPDNGTIAILVTQQPESAAVRAFIRLVDIQTGEKTDMEIPLPQNIDLKGKLGELAWSPDGTHAAASFAGVVNFMDNQANVLGSWVGRSDEAFEEYLYQPAFSPDGKVVAMKHLVKSDKTARTEAIIFFDPQGGEIARMPIPPIESPEEQ